MENTVFVTGSDRGLGYALCAGFLARGWCVYAGQYMPDWPDLALLAQQFPGALQIVPLDVNSTASSQAAAQAVARSTDHVDLLINNAGVISPSQQISIRELQDTNDIHRLFDTNAVGPLRVVTAFLPLMDRSALKRLCFISSEAGSIERSTRKAWYGYCMSKSALNMAVKITFNQLRPEGYTFRLYHPGWMRTYMQGHKAVLGDMEPEQAAARAIPFFLCDRDEDRLVMVDYLGQEWPW